MPPKHEKKEKKKEKKKERKESDIGLHGFKRLGISSY